MKKIKPGSPFLARASNEFKPTVPFLGARARTPKEEQAKHALAPRGGNLRRTRKLIAEGGDPKFKIVKPERYLHASRSAR